MKMCPVHGSVSPESEIIMYRRYRLIKIRVKRAHRHTHRELEWMMAHPQHHVQELPAFCTHVRTDWHAPARPSVPWLQGRRHLHPIIFYIKGFQVSSLQPAAAPLPHPPLSMSELICPSRVHVPRVYTSISALGSAPIPGLHDCVSPARATSPSPGQSPVPDKNGDSAKMILSLMTVAYCLRLWSVWFLPSQSGVFLLCCEVYSDNLNLVFCLF